MYFYWLGIVIELIFIVWALKARNQKALYSATVAFLIAAMFALKMDSEIPVIIALIMVIVPILALMLGQHIRYKKIAP